ncbi:very short patch repair endonuclease [Chryseobacterium lineare]
MSRIASKETKPEVQIRKALFKKGFRYRKNVKTLSGTPDIVLAKYKTVIFINGCFWHGHNCKKGALPTTRVEFWIEKIGKNKDRDLRNIIDLKNEGWKVITVWQCEISNKKLLDLKIEELSNSIKKISNI